MNQETRMSKGFLRSHSAPCSKLTQAELLFPLPEPSARKQLEEYRIEYEAAYGPTDLTRRYTSTWPVEHQNWLITHETRRYFDGLPPFVKSWIKGKLLTAADRGKLDDVPDEYLRLFLKKEMRLDPPQPGFHGW